MTITQKILIAIVAFFGIILILQIYIDTSDYLESPELHEKRVQIDSSRLLGYDDGKINWEISSEEAWTGANKYIFYLDYLNKGKLYDDDGSLILDNLRADEARVNSKSRTIIAKNNIFASFLKTDDDDNDEDPVTIEVMADELKYFSYNKKTYLIGNVKITRGKDSIIAEKIELENDDNILVISKPFRVENEEYIASANQMKLYIDDDMAELIGDVSVYRPAEFGVTQNVQEREKEVRGRETWIKAAYLKQVELENDQSITTVSGNIIVQQEGRVLKGDHLVFKKDQQFLMEGNVDVDLDDLNWALRPKKREEVQNDDVNERLSKPLYLNADILDVDLVKKRFDLKGDVVMIQDDTHTTCRVLRFYDESDEIELYQDVVLKRGEGDTLFTDAVTININNESFNTTVIPKIEEGMEYKSPLKLEVYAKLVGVDRLVIEEGPDWIRLEDGFIVANAPIGSRIDSPYKLQLKSSVGLIDTIVPVTVLVIAQNKEERDYNQLNQPEISFDLDD